MALQASMSLNTIASTSSELWPSMEKVLKAPWIRYDRQLGSASSASRRVPSHVSKTEEAALVTPSPSKLPDCLRLVNLADIVMRPTLMHTAPTTTSILGYTSRDALRSCSVLARPMPQPQLTTRQYSTFNRLGPFKLQSIQRPKEMMFGQYRTMYGANPSRNQLAHMELTANNNPTSATAQNAFYSALLRANMPEILVERYQTGRYASNPACEALYGRALERLGQTEGLSGLQTQANQGHNSNVTPEQLQSIGQAIAAKSRGGNMAKVTGGTGTKEGPLYVVVDESAGNIAFKWAKFILWYAMLGYFFLIVVTLFVDATGVLKKVSGSQDAEAKPELQTTRFSDVHGCDEAKEELQELVEFLKAPERFSTLGGKLPKGVLLVGPPGTGKTLLARAVAGEAGVPFFYMSGSEFDEVYVGVGAKRVRELFNAARQKAPAIVFIDELDAIGGKRNERDAAYVKQTLNQLLTDLDGFDQNSGVIFLAATNFPQMLDKALTRPGRFDRNVVVPLPDVRGRVAILKHHMKNMQLSTEVDASVIARGTPGFSGAELENLVNQAAVRASKNKSQNIGMLDLEWAKDKILMGAERRSAVIKESDKLATAYHEGGHALVALYNPNADKLYKATIMPRGMALGLTFSLPEMDAVSRAKKQFLAEMDVCMGGKVAEEIIYGEDSVTSGASSDLQRATNIAWAMVTQYGMSNTLGNMDFASDFARLSTETKSKIESEIRVLLDDSYARAKKVLTERRKELDLLAKGLVAYETLSKDEIEKVIKGEKLPERLAALEGAPMKLPAQPTPVPIAGKPAGPPTPGMASAGAGETSPKS
ncbi:cell division protease ftsH [Pseudovirgaria hyperparasitica]|uniref:Cell division protease ftsH n=1 Tax=Pseudovirgaria hyperparasitica TaxID=470096 RepID=A0A6A6VVZ2_9PEZI|nr:cell division protease ftsH [Pseudovirgaria hyperparasitica]KAF2754752.1 cell division protease ftsH [Pseudovirgaria hyperparasitica]